MIVKKIEHKLKKIQTKEIRTLEFSKLTILFRKDGVI